MDWILPHDYQGSPAAYVVVVLAALAITGISKGGFGGIGALAVPLLLLVMSPALALGMWLPLLVWQDVLTMRHYPREWKWRPILVIAPWSLLGVVIGWYLLGRLNADVLKFAVGILSLGFVVMEGVRTWVARFVQKPGHDQAWRPSVLSASPFGLAAGISTMIAHAAGSFTTIYFLLQRLDQRSFVGTSARYYFVFNTLKIPFMVQREFISRESLVLSLWLVPLSLPAVWLGVYLNHRFSPKTFSRTVYALLAVTGLYLMIANWP